MKTKQKQQTKKPKKKKKKKHSKLTRAAEILPRLDKYIYR
jgi:hypothetical protein